MIWSNPTVIAALISAAIAALGLAATFYVSRHQLRGRTVELELRAKELELRSKELERFALELEADAEARRQHQLTEVVKARIAAYPKLWYILLAFGRNWTLEGKPRDAAWARSFLVALNGCNAEIGVFFSEPVYAKFHEFRSLLVVIEGKLRRGDVVYEDEHAELLKIVVGDSLNRVPGLATHLKNDLGSYQSAALQTAPRRDA